MRLIFARALAMCAIALVVGIWFAPELNQAARELLLLIGVGAASTLAMQMLLVKSRVAEKLQLIIQYGSDLIVAALLIYVTGGVSSPFSLLLGLIIIASGSHASRSLPVLMTALGSAAYLLAIFAENWGVRGAPFSTQQHLHVLMQCSALLLVGGVMALIARRHASLTARTDLVVHQHLKLKGLHDQVMDSMLEGVLLLDEALNVNDMNTAARRQLGQGGLARLLETPALKKFLLKPDAPIFSCEFRNGEQILRVAATRLIPEGSADWLMTLVDISDIRRLEQQLIQQEKMAMLGQMAAMLAHEIRNPIQTMAQGLELMEKNHASRESVQEILRDEMSRLKRLVMTMLNYSQPLKPHPEPTWMPELLKQAVAQQGLAHPEDVHVHCSCNELEIDGDHLRLVLDNLLSNALSNRVIATPVELRLERDSESWLMSVCNQGEIAASVNQSLFEPFVTGRTSGFGLGLATVKQVCQANGWAIALECSDGHTCFRISGKRAEIVVMDREESHG